MFFFLNLRVSQLRSWVFEELGTKGITELIKLKVLLSSQSYDRSSDVLERKSTIRGEKRTIEVKFDSPFWQRLGMFHSGRYLENRVMCKLL